MIEKSPKFFDSDENFGAEKPIGSEKIIVNCLPLTFKIECWKIPSQANDSNMYVFFKHVITQT